MFTKSKLIHALPVFSLILILSIVAVADTIRLKDGSIIKGKIISFGSGQFIILVGEGSRQRKLNFFADEIDSIQFDSEGNSAAVLKTSTSSTDDAPARPAYTKTTDGDNTIITVGSAPATTPAESETDDDVIDDTDSPISIDAATSAQPIKISTKVLADNTANGWTNSGWVVRKGQKIRITGSGRISLGNGRYSSPSGISTLPDSQKLIKEKPTGGLIAVIGDDNNEFIFIGGELEFTATRDGALFLGINEGVLADNTGSFDVTIEIDAETGK